MKLLIAIKSDYPKRVANDVLRWVGRGGFDVKLFIPSHKYKQFVNAVADANYHHYLALSNSIIVLNSEPKRYAKLNGYDLLLTVAPDLLSWKSSLRFKDDEIKVFHMAIAEARVMFSKHPNKRIKRFSNGSVLERII